MSTPRAVATLMVLLTTSAAGGEDSWLIANASSINDGEPLWLSFVTGERFPIGETVPSPGLIEEFIDRYGAETRRIEGAARQDRGLSVRTPAVGPGVHVFGCEAKRDLVRIPAEEFDAYLLRERAEKALAIRGPSVPLPGKDDVWEAYTKYAKTIVEVHPIQEGDLGYRQALGHRLEIIPLSNPCRWRRGETVPIEVRLDGYPWGNVAVAAGHEGLEDWNYAVETRTNANGVANLTLDRAGHWFVRAHVIHPTDGLGRPAWESFWATLTFRVTGPADVGDALRSLRAAGRALEPWLAAVHHFGKRMAIGLRRDVLLVFRGGAPPPARVASVPKDSAVRIAATAGP